MKVGVTGPVKFSFNTGEIERHAMAFWCVMIPRKLFDEIGLLDEIFSPGMGEDGDFCIRAEQAGYSLVQVPTDMSIKFGNPIEKFDFPIAHVGSGTFGWMDGGDIIERNKQILNERYGTMDKPDSLEVAYEWCKMHVSDINEHIETIRRYATGCQHITEFGTRGCVSTYALMAARPKKFLTYDLNVPGEIWTADTIAKEHGIEFGFMERNTIQIDPIEQTDLLFIDTLHTYDQLKKELAIHAKQVRKYLIFHDTTTFGHVDEITGEEKGLWPAIQEFLDQGEWELLQKYENCNGLTVLGRVPRLHNRDEFFLPRAYVTNEVKYFDDTNSSGDFQIEVYQRAAEIAKADGYTTVLDLGCGSGINLMRYLEEFDTTGVDLEATLPHLAKTYPTRRWVGIDLENPGNLPEQLSYDLIICSDVIEHLRDPNKLLAFIKKLEFKTIIFSTPDRELMEARGYPRFGPPENPCHVREWSKHEFKRYIENAGFTIDNHVISNVPQATQMIECSYKRPNISIVMPTMNHFEDAFKPGIDALLAYTDLSNKEVIVVANGYNENDNTRAYLEQLGSKVRYVWIKKPAGYIGAVNAGIEVSDGKYIVLIDNDSHLLPQETDAWINILKKPFDEQPLVGATSPFANEYPDMGLVLHSGCTMYRADLLREIGMFDRIYMPGYLSDSDVSMKIWNAGYSCVEVPEQNQNKLYANGVFSIQFPVYHGGHVQTMDKVKDEPIIAKNRKILYERWGKKKVKYSIVIPTYNHCDDLLKPCIESILEFTDMDNVEVIVVANGCVDNTKEYVESLDPKHFKLIWIEEPSGYTKSTNVGIKAATGEFVILLNNDTQILPSHKNDWLKILEAPFAKKTMGMTGPLELFDRYANMPVLIFFCVMIRREVIDKIGLLDEIYSPGGGEDIDYTGRVRAAGYEAICIDKTTYNGVTNVGLYPMWHKDNRTFSEIPEYTNWIIKRNGHINCKKYNKDIKLNLGGGGIDYPGYLSVDLYDKRAHIKMDITKLDFDDNSVTEILASHVFEHLNPYHSTDILREWLRVLKPGGKIVMEMPDIEKLCEKFLKSDTGGRYGVLNSIYGSVNTTNEGGPDNITSPHLFGWWPQSLYDHMSNAGFTNIVFMDEQIPHPEANFRVEAIKPGQTELTRADLEQQDTQLCFEILDRKEYGILPEEFAGKDVLDIGANIGVFSFYAMNGGANRVVAVEANPVIFGALSSNAKRMKNVTAINAAAWSTNDDTISIQHHGVMSRVSEIGMPVKTITLEKLSEGFTDAILKLDVEGSEFEVLKYVQPDTLRKFQTILIELHGEYGDISTIRAMFENCGFRKVHQFQYYNDDGLIEVYVERWARV